MVDIVQFPDHKGEAVTAILAHLEKVKDSIDSVLISVQYRDSSEIIWSKMARQELAYHKVILDININDTLTEYE
jgi:hypothetical protein